MKSGWFQISNEAEIPSPALLIFRERVEENIRRMIELAGGPERLWPHVKTHKLGPIVRMQIDRGIQRFKCATVAEAEMTAQAGAKEVLLAFQPVGPAAQRLANLQRRCPETAFSTICDAEEPMRELGAAAQAAGVAIGVFLDLDCGMHRTGIAPGEAAVSLYRRLCETPGLQPLGLHAYDGHIHEPDPEKRAAQCDAEFAPVLAFWEELKRSGLSAPRLIAGGTPTFPIHAKHPDRDLSPGTCVLWDFGYGDKFRDLPFSSAAVLLTRVVSKPGPNRLCLDLGHKAVAAENPHPRVRLLEIPDAVAAVHSEEHLVVETPAASQYRIGDRLHGIPRHVCPTVALHSEAWIVSDGAARECWPIAARARRITV